MTHSNYPQLAKLTRIRPFNGHNRVIIHSSELSQDFSQAIAIAKTIGGKRYGKTSHIVFDGYVDMLTWNDIQDGIKRFHQNNSN